MSSQTLNAGKKHHESIIRNYHDIPREKGETRLELGYPVNPLMPQERSSAASKRELEGHYP